MKALETTNTRNYVYGQARFIKNELDNSCDAARTLAQSMQRYDLIPERQRRTIFNSLIEGVLRANPEFLSVWTAWEKHTIDNLDSIYAVPALGYTGQYLGTYFRSGGQIKKEINTSAKETELETEDFYQLPKKKRTECIIEPYYYSYSGKKNDEILETSLVIPVLRGSRFIGVVGIDIPLDYFQNIIDTSHYRKSGISMLISSEGNFVGHPVKVNISKPFRDIYPKIEKQYNITERLKNGERFEILADLNETGQPYLLFFEPIPTGKSTMTWTYCLALPITKLTEAGDNNLFVILIIGLIGFVVLLIIVWIIVNVIFDRLAQIIANLRTMAVGNISNLKYIPITSKNEIDEIANSINTLVDGLKHSVDFAEEIGKGNLNTPYELLSNKDLLGLSLIEMQKSLQRANEEEQKRKDADLLQNWANRGIARFADILRQNQNDIRELGYKIIAQLVDYLNIKQGTLFILNDENREEIFLELIAAFAFDKRRYIKRQIMINEGLVGTCAMERKTVYLTDLPEDYTNISSGLGSATPKSLLLVPLKRENELLGVVELASFEFFKKHEIEFVEKIGESIASTLFSVKINERTTRLLERAQEQQEAMAAQEEEMRQNMEELQATQEEMHRKTRDLEASAADEMENLQSCFDAYKVEAIKKEEELQNRIKELEIEINHLKNDDR